jgi:hypothetical protein
MTAVKRTHPGSGPANTNNQSPSQNMSVSAKIAGLGLLFLGLIAATVTAIVYSWHPEANSRELELLKACFSVVVVAFVGGLATFAFGILQRDRDRRQDEARRDIERRIDERRRRDEQVSAVLGDTLEHWLAVKRIRRELEAATWTGSSASITLDDYDRYLRKINQHQLAFERLKKIALLLDERIPHITSTNSDSLEKLFYGIEDFLNDVVDEYQRSRYIVANAGKLELADLTAHSNVLPKRVRCPPGSNKPEQRKTLQDFIYETSIFRERGSNDVDEVVHRLEQAILEPLDLSRSPKAKKRTTGK